MIDSATEEKRASLRAASPRGRGRSISSIVSIRPGRGDITTTRSDSSTASSIEWVMNSTVFFVFSQDPLEIEAHLLARQRIERAEWLVHHQKRRLVHQRAGDGDALLHAAGQFVGPLVGEIAQADRLE